MLGVCRAYVTVGNRVCVWIQAVKKLRSEWLTQLALLSCNTCNAVRVSLQPYRKRLHIMLLDDTAADQWLREDS